MPFNDYRRDLMGKADVAPKGAFTVGSWGSFTLTYTAGKFGIDDRGSLKVALRGHADNTKLQTTDPKAPGYTTVEASNGAELDISYEFRRNIRPWNHSLFIRCLRYLKEGDTLTIRIGDQRQGSPGIRLQTIVEDTFEFRFFVDPFACYDFIPLPDDEQPTIKMIPGEPVLFKALLPSLRRPGEKFRLAVKSEDRWGNPTDRFEGIIKLQASHPIPGLPETIRIDSGDYSHIVEDLHVDEPGTYRIDLSDENDRPLCQTNPLIIQEGSFAHFWSDMHGQSEETIGTNSARDYFLFARDKAFLDITGHQGNDFQITDAFWEELNDLTREFEEPGQFLAIPGYEWSGNTSLGGDHNVWYRHEGRPIYRSCRALIPDRTFPENDCHSSAELFERLKDEDAIVVAHVGGRYADVSLAHDAKLEPSVEVHSSWGTFEWILWDALAEGYRVGIVASSDGHKGRPGASYPGPASFGSYGGLTCHLLPELSRDALFEAFRNRQHYATTGARIYLDVSVRIPGGGTDDRNRPVSEAQMGAILTTDGGEISLQYSVEGSAPLERIDLFDGPTIIQTLRPAVASETSEDRLRLVCRGQLYRGRGRMVNWTGKATLSAGKIERFNPICYWNPDRQPELEDDQTITWKTVTTGGVSSIDLWVSPEAWSGTIDLDTNEFTSTLTLADITTEGKIFDCGGMDKQFIVQRLPRAMTETRAAGELDLSLDAKQERQLFVRVTQEDGHQAWSSPIYVTRAT